SQVYLDRHAPTGRELEDWIAERKEKGPPPPRPDLSDEEYLYLSSQSRTEDRHDGVILESRTWVERMEKTVRRELRLRYGDLLERLAGDGAGPAGENVIRDEDEEQHRNLYRYFPE